MNTLELLNRARQLPRKIKHAKAEAFSEIIAHLASECYSSRDISNYLAENGHKISHQSVWKFLKKRSGANPLAPITPAGNDAQRLPQPAATMSIPPAKQYHPEYQTIEVMTEEEALLYKLKRKHSTS